MSLKAPNLDNRSFDLMVEESLRRIEELCPQWTDHTKSDPGVILLELFAYLNEAMIYRLNRLPEKAYVEFLRLIGVTISPPSSAVVNLKFSVAKPVPQPLEIPRGTKVSINRSGGSGPEPPVFTTLQTVSIPKNKTEVEVLAYQCELVEAELAGKGSGTYGLTVTIKRPPIVAPINEDLKMLVGVETPVEEMTERIPVIKYGEKAYRIWEEVPNFSNLDGKEHVYTVDRVTGVISFAPLVQLKEPEGQLQLIGYGLAEKPREGSEIRVWYCRGGGAQGNVSRETLIVMKTPMAGVSVINPEAATGGRDTETLQNALLRGPQEFHSLQRAVTASDFELLAKRNSGAVARAKAFTRADLWVHALPGTVEVLLVPDVPLEQRQDDRVDIKSLQERETNEAKQIIFNALEEKRPLGTSTLVNWVRYKKVSASARAVMRHGSDAASLKERILKRLYRHINPLPTETSGGWEFGEPLRVSHIYDIVLKEPDVRYVEDVKLHLDEVPAKDITALTADAFQPNTWYSSTGPDLFRSMDDGDGWELIKTFTGELTHIINSNKNRPGMLAVVTKLPVNGSHLYVSEDCGESWRTLAQTEFLINDISWTMRNSLPLLMLATDKGLYELSLQEGASPVMIEVDPQKRDLGFYAVTASIGIRGTFYVAVAARNLGGVYLSSQGGRKESFTNIGLQKEDIRVMRIQQDGVRTYLWAGITVAGNEQGKGCFRWELQGSDPPTSGTKFQTNWDGGSCHSLTFKGPYAFAATHDKGVLWLDTSKGESAAWHVPPDFKSGLPMRDTAHNYATVTDVAAHSEKSCVMAGTAGGVYRSKDDGTTYESVSKNIFTDKVTLPNTWLLCSGDHQIEVVSEDEAKRD
jgi:hypothetical protein